MLTVVSGYWRIPNKHGDDRFMDWFKTSLQINAPYVFFGTKETIEIARRFRSLLPTHYIEMELSDFYTQKYKHLMLTHPTHCPSAELNMIWNEKLFLIQKAAALNPFKTEWFAWIDAGICTYRTQMPPAAPWPSPAKLTDLPHDRLIFTSSILPTFNPSAFSKLNYNHFVSGTYAIHGSFIDTFTAKFAEYLAKYLPMRCNLFTDQVILTYIYKDFPDLFYRLGHGYGALLAGLR